jgi:2-polyprenyl-3-methyl-5-hydroxy-6-metoxy-1,4-benzoquinol methylase
MTTPLAGINYAELPIGSCPICSSDLFTPVTIRFDSGRIVRCSDCQHIYLNPTLSDRIIDSIYQEYHIVASDAALMNRIEGWFVDPLGPYQYMLNLIERKGGFTGKRILEVGCGPGHFINECSRLGGLVTGVDISPGAVRLAKQYFNLDLVHKTVDQALIDGDLHESAFDYIFAFEVIEHVPRPGDFIEKLSQLLVPGGLLSLSTPNFALFYALGSAAAVVSQWPEHLHFFDPSSLGSLLRRQNLELSDITTVMPLTYAGRQKQTLMRQPWLKLLWDRLRGIAIVYYLKDKVFQLLDRRREPLDVKSWNGTCLVGVAQKPVATKANRV